MRRSDYVLKRALFAFVTFVIALTLNFVIFRAAPGDAASALGDCRGCTPSFERSLRKELGLDKSKLEQYAIYLQQLGRGDLGRSLVSRRPVSEVLFPSLVNTLPMIALGLLLGLVFGTLLGLLAVWRRGTALDSGGLSLALILNSLPTQWLALMLILIFAGRLPTSGLSDPYVEFTNPSTWTVVVDRIEHMILPSLTLGLVYLGSFALIVRSSLLDALGEDFILTARAKGLSRWTIIHRHALRHSLLPIVTLAALSFGTMVGGAVLVESVFSYQGIGYETYQAVLERDYPVLQGAFLILTCSVIIVNFAADLLYFKIDPRISS